MNQQISGRSGSRESELGQSASRRGFLKASLGGLGLSLVGTRAMKRAMRTPTFQRADPLRLFESSKSREYGRFDSCW